MSMNCSNVSFEPVGFNYGQQPHQNGIACKLCSHVSPDFEAFIAHTESHFAQQNSMRRLYSQNGVNSQRGIIPNPLQTNFPRPMMLQETRSCNNIVLQTSPLQPVLIPRPRTNLLFPDARRQVTAASQSFHGPPLAMSFDRNSVTQMTSLRSPLIHQREMKTSPIDGTKPYINLLDKPLSNNRFFKWAIISGDSLDLSLRL